MAADLNTLPDGFVLDAPKAPSSPQGAKGLPDGFVMDAPHPAAGLPMPAEAVAQAQLNAKQVADMLTTVGNQMHADAVAKIPHELRGYTPQELSRPGSFINPRTGQQSTVAGDQAQVPVLDDPLNGGKQIVQGVEQAAEPGLADKAGGASKIIRGGLQASTPMLPGAIVAAPLATIGAVGAGTLAQTGTEAGMKKAGVPDSYAELAGDTAGLVAGGVAGHLAGKLGPKPALTPDQVLGPERAPMDRQVPGDVAGENDGLAGKQPVSSRTVKPGSGSTPPVPEGFVLDRPPKEPVTVRSKQTSAKGENANDNRNAVSVDGQGDGARAEGQSAESVEAQQGRAAEKGQANDGTNQPAQQPDASAAAQNGTEEAQPVERGPVAYGHDVAVNVPGEQTSYPARYAVRELEDVQPSHNPHSFERNPQYEYENDRDYSNPQNAARVAENATPGRFNPDFHLTPSPTAEQGSPIIDQRGNALGGNSRTMQLNRVYATGDDAGYRQTLGDRAQQFGLDPAEVQKFQRPILTRELTNTIDKPTAQKAITDFNKTAAAKLAPEEQAVADGRRLSQDTVGAINSNLAEVGEGSTLAQALKGDNGVDILNRLVKDGVLTNQEKNGYLDERGQLTGGAKDRIAKALVGRMFETAGDYAETAPSIRNNLERIAPHVMRVEDRPDWKITATTREAISALADAKAHGIDNLQDLNRQSSLTGGKQPYSEDALAIAEKLRQGPNKATSAFRQYAQDADLSGEGSNATFFEPPTQREAFHAAFGEGNPLMAVASQRPKPLDLSRTSSFTGQYARQQDTGHHLMRAQADEFPLPPEDAKHGKALLVNMNGMELISRLSGLPVDHATRLGGLHMNSHHAGVLAKTMAGWLRQMAHAPRGAFEMQRVAHEAASQGTSLSFALRHEKVPLAVTRGALREELDHAMQEQLGGDNLLQHGGERAPQFTDRALGLRAVRALTNNAKYRFRSPGEAAAEIGVRLMAQDRHAELGLSLYEARTLGAHYVRLLRKEYGHDKPRAIAARIFDALRRPDRGGTGEPGDVPGGTGSGGRSGAAGGAGQDLQASRTTKQDDLSGGLSGTPKDPTARRNVRDAKSGSLFDDSETKQVADGVARDRAKLEGERLSAQFDSPITRDEQLRKLKRKESSQQDLFGDGKPTPAQGTLFSRLIDDEELPEGKYHYSGLGAFEDKTIRNLSQLRRASEPAHMGAVKSASSKSQAAVILKTAMPKIEKALDGVTTPENFRRALVQSRLEGIRERWQNLGEFAARASEGNLTKSMERLYPLLDNLADKRGFNRNLADTAAALAEHSDYANLRRLLVNTFADAAKSVTRVMPADEFIGLKNSPDFQAALGKYKDLVEAPMAKNHAQNEGIFSDALGPLDTYYPLIPIREGDAVRARVGSKPEYSKPRNIANHFATGLSEDYDTSMEELRRRLTAGVKSNNKAALMKTLQDAKLVKKLEPWAPVPDTIDYQGQPYQAVAMETTPARQIISNGKVVNRTPDRVLVPKWLEKELRPVLQNRTKPEPPGALRQLLDKLNTVAISGPADAVFHSSNLFGTLVANTPFLGKSLLNKVGSVPIAKRFAAITKVAMTDPMTETSAKDLQEMSNLGILPDRFASETYSKKYAEQTGAELKRFSAGPLLYGPKGVDVRARLVMYRIAKELNPKASGTQLHMFTNQLGNYVDALHSDVERASKHSGLAPFFTAGSTMLRNGVNAWTGTGPMPSNDFSHRIWQQLTGGGIGTVALWMLAYKAYTGQYPWEDKRARLLQIPANPGDRQSAIGKALWGKGSDTGYINFTFFNPMVGRGERALGIKGAADTELEGGKWWQSVEAAQKDMMNSAAHPFMGPVPRAAFVGLTGDEPYLTGLRDDRARLAPQLMPSVRKAGEGGSILKRAGGAAKELNSFYGNVSAAVGLGEQDPHSSANKWVRMAADLTAPGLVANAQNPYRQAAAVRRQAAEAKRQR